MSKSRMKNTGLFLVSELLVAFLFSGGIAASESSGPTMDTAAIERLTAAKGALDEKEGVFKVSVPRKDLSVTVAGVKMTPPMGLTSWAAFKRDGKDDMVMGDRKLPAFLLISAKRTESLCLFAGCRSLTRTALQRNWRISNSVS
jgi:hypothetical protein